MAGGYRVPSPAPEALVAWPERFGSRFLIFVDTEEEFDWASGFSRDNRSVTHVAALPEAHRRFADQGAALTYMVDHPIAASPEAAAVLREILEDPRAAVGTQLHPWVNPPFEEELSVRNSFAGNLPPDLEAAKLMLLTETIETALGRRPLAYRAGRYGIGPSTFAALAQLGYRVDTSMRAGYDYSPEAGPDFTAIGNAAFRTGPDEAILEIPFTTVFTGRLRRRGASLYRRLGAIPRGRGIAARLGQLSRVSLTPEDMPLKDAIEALWVAAGEDVPLLNFAFHSPSLVPGHTPYVRDAAALAEFHRWWDVILDLLLRLGFHSASLAEVIEAADAACSSPPSSAIAAPAGGL